MKLVKTCRIGRWHLSDNSKLETAKVADSATSRFYSGPKLQRERITGQIIEGQIIEDAFRIGRWHPSDDSKLETAKVADPTSSRLYSGPKLQRERGKGHKFETTLSVASKVASYYECQGIGHFAKECPAQRRRRGRTRNSPGKGNPSERSRSNEARLNPEL